MSSIKFRELDSRFDDIDKALDDTCIWLLHDPKYIEWSHEKKTLLLLTGHRTSGKSTLMKNAFERLKSDTELVVMSHFFWRSGTVELQRDACGFFRSLMCQFLPYSISSLDAAMEKYQGMKSEPVWHPKWMREFLRKAIPQACKSESLRIVIFVDAIDECDEKDRTDIMDFLKLLSKSPEVDLRICVSYSPGGVSEEADIDMVLYNSEDITKYVQNKLSPPRETELSAPLKTKLSILPTTQLFEPRSIPRDIQKMAQGMFLWAEFCCTKVVEMHAKGKAAKAILQAIESLPKKLDDIFMDLLDDLTQGDAEDAEESLKLFRWMCFARRPLSIAELRYAIMLDPGMEENSIKKIHENPNFREEQTDVINAVIYLSKGLAKIVDRASFYYGPPRPKRACDREVHFIHDCVREFLLDRGFESLRKSSGNEDAASSGHFYLSRSCIKYLTMEECIRYLTMKKRSVRASKEEEEREVSSFPLLRYAATSWIFHTEQVESANKPQDDLPELFHWPSPHIINAWADWIYFQTPWSEMGRGINLLHVSAEHGLVSLLTAILNGSKIQGGETVGEHQTNHSQDADEGQNKAVISSAELTRGIIEKGDSLGRTPLCYAARANKVAAAKLLLKHNANPNAKAIQEAAHHAGEKMMELFSKAEKFQVTEAVLTAAAGNFFYGAEVMRILLDKLPKFEITLGMVQAASKTSKSGSEVLKMLIQDPKLETNTLEGILGMILKLSNADVTRAFILAHKGEIEISEQMLVDAVSNRKHGAKITVLLFDPRMELFLGPKGPGRITERIMKSAASNREQGQEVMQALLRHQSFGVTSNVLTLATKSWRFGANAMTMLLKCKKIRKISYNIMVAAAGNTIGGWEIRRIFLKERRSELLQNSLELGSVVPDMFLQRAASDERHGAEVMKQLLDQPQFPVKITQKIVRLIVSNGLSGAEIMEVLLRKKRSKVLRLLTKDDKRIAEDNWGHEIAEGVFRQGSILAHIEKGGNAEEVSSMAERRRPPMTTQQTQRKRGEEGTGETSGGGLILDVQTKAGLVSNSPG